MCVISARCPQIKLKANQEPQAIAGPTPLPWLRHYKSDPHVKWYLDNTHTHTGAGRDVDRAEAVSDVWWDWWKLGAKEACRSGQMSNVFVVLTVFVSLRQRLEEERTPKRAACAKCKRPLFVIACKLCSKFHHHYLTTTTGLHTQTHLHTDSSASSWAGAKKKASSVMLYLTERCYVKLLLLLPL